MTEQFTTIDEAKKRRNELLDAVGYVFRPSFAERYTRASIETFERYCREVYKAVDDAVLPGGIAWPDVPIAQSIDEYNASLEPANEPAL
jgi:hypothetical protein